MPLISVVIPVYNSRDVLGRCLESLVSQTFSDWEAVCVDDGSTDGSGEMLDRYSSSDPRIRVIHKENAGVGAARNTAVSEVHGNYVLFVDSDDFLHPQTMELCVNLARMQSADIVAFTYDRRYRTAATLKHCLHLPFPLKPSFRRYDPCKLDYLVTDDIWEFATEYSVKDKWAVKHCQPWRCLYRTSVVRNVHFPEGVIYEDFPWWSEVLLNVRLAVILNLPLYFYYPSFGGYIFSSGQQRKIDSLRKCLDYADTVMNEKASGRELDLWRKNFRAAFDSKLRKKIEKYG